MGRAVSVCVVVCGLALMAGAGAMAASADDLVERWMVGSHRTPGVFEAMFKALKPVGVWTLPPTLRLGDKDAAKYLAIGESDRMTLRFVRPEKKRSKR